MKKKKKVVANCYWYDIGLRYNIKTLQVINLEKLFQNLFLKVMSFYRNIKHLP